MELHKVAIGELASKEFMVAGGVLALVKVKELRRQARSTCFKRVISEGYIVLNGTLSVNLTYPPVCRTAEPGGI